MKDSQHSVETQEAPRKYIKANNERFSTGSAARVEAF